MWQKFGKISGKVLAKFSGKFLGENFGESFVKFRHMTKFPQKNCPKQFRQKLCTDFEDFFFPIFSHEFLLTKLFSCALGPKELKKDDKLIWFSKASTYFTVVYRGGSEYKKIYTNPRGRKPQTYTSPLTHFKWRSSLFLNVSIVLQLTISWVSRFHSKTTLLLNANLPTSVTNLFLNNLWLWPLKLPLDTVKYSVGFTWSMPLKILNTVIRSPCKRLVSRVVILYSVIFS